MSTFLTVLAILSALVVLVIDRARRRHRGLSLPPGPRKYPIIANLLNAPREYQWLHYEKWGKEFNSDIIHMEELGASHIVLNTFEAANELLNVRSAIYSNRPRQVMLQEMYSLSVFYCFGLSGPLISMGQNFALVFVPYSNKWRARRRLFWQEFNPTNQHFREPVQARSTKRLLRSLLKAPEDFLGHIRYELGASILEITYGITPKLSNDPIIELADKVMRNWGATAIYGAYIVDIIPILKYIPRWMPGAGFKKLGDMARHDVDQMLNVPFGLAQDAVTRGDHPPSLISRTLAKYGDHTLSADEEQVLKDVAGVAYEGGIDTTPSAASTFFVAIVLYPHVQAKAQKELDGYLDRLPELGDRPELLYIEAVMLEILRWQPAIPLGVSHSVITDDEYKGFYIPKNSTVTANVWAILNDEALFPNPREFQPERFLVSGEIDQTLSSVVMSAFGFGRRRCPGRFMAMDSLWLDIASILYLFNITKALDDNGQAVTPDINYYPHFIRQVAPFKCSIKPRSDEARKLIEGLAVD